VYPHFLLADATKDELALPRISRATNDAMADRALDALAGALGGLEGRRVLVLGASYREDVKEMAFSTAIPLVEELHRRGAVVLVNDPLFEPRELAALEAELADLGGDAPLQIDAVIVQAFHSQYRGLDWKRFRGLEVVFDGRGYLDPDAIRKTGAAYLAVETPPK
jgi:UDP-N-acetyl-D-mannosaminuronate dehydrogenase